MVNGLGKISLSPLDPLSTFIRVLQWDFQSNRLLSIFFL